MSANVTHFLARDIQFGIFLPHLEQAQKRSKIKNEVDTLKDSDTNKNSDVDFNYISY